MITSREDYLRYLEQDRLAMGIPDAVKRPRLGQDEIWRWMRLLRKTEYVTNCKHGKLWHMYELILKLIYRKKSIHLGFSIPLNVFGEGLYIPHYGTIVVNGRAKIGKNCRLQEGTNIGDSRGGVPTIGDNVYICSGAKIMGPIAVANGVIVGAQAFVNKSIEEPDITVAGIPAKKVGENSSWPYLNARLFN